MLTEDDAAEVWCSEVRLYPEQSSIPPQTFAYNRPHAMEGMCCLGSKCAHWRWGEPIPEALDRKTVDWWPPEDISDEEYEKAVAAAAEKEPKRPADAPRSWEWQPLKLDDVSGEWIAGGAWREPDSEYEIRAARHTRSRRGYCGLSGKPEFVE